MNRGGIYKITNTTNNKTYIGSTKNFRIRKSTHFYKLRRNLHGNKHLQSSYNKHGFSNFIFEVLEIVEDLSNIIVREQYWIDTLKPEYNKRIIAQSCLGMKISESHKQALINSRKGIKMSENHKSLISLANTGKKRTEEFKTRMRDLKLGNIISEDTKLKISIANKGRKPSINMINANIERLSISVIQLDANGTFIKEWKSATEASRFLPKVTQGRVTMCCKGKAKTAGKFKWMYLKDYQRIREGSYV